VNPDALPSTLLQVLAWGALPAWVLAGLGDWSCHAWSRIERRSGVPESLMHVGQFALIAAPVLLGLYARMNALVLIILGACVAVHTVLGWIDTAYTQPRRYIAPFEQAIHPWLELLPVFALVIVAVLYADAWRAPEWSLHASDAPLPAWARYGVPLALLPGAALAVEELVRCSRARASALIPSAAGATISPSRDVP
jgi:hypothetical protein